MSKEKQNVVLKGLWNICQNGFQALLSAPSELSTMGKWFWVNFSMGLVICVIWSFKKTHLWILHWVKPQLFSNTFINYFNRVQTHNHLLFLVGPYLILSLIFVGYARFIKIHRCREAFKKVGIKNNLGQYPTIVEYKKTSDYSSRIRLLIDGIDSGEFTQKTNALQSSMRALIEDIRQEDNPHFLSLYLTTRPIPKKVMYQDLCAITEAPYTFIVGDTLGQIVTQDLTQLPHMLIAGVTGSGKSAFLKQVILSLLEKTYDSSVSSRS